MNSSFRTTGYVPITSQLKSGLRRKIGRKWLIAKKRGLGERLARNEEATGSVPIRIISLLDMLPLLQGPTLNLASRALTALAATAAG